MFSIRIKQLERRLSDYDYGGAEAPEELVSELKRLYNILDQVNVLGQIFSRNVSQLAVEEVSEEILKKIKILIHVGQLVLIKISDETCGTSFPIDDYSNLKIDKKEFKFIQNDLRSMKKNKNKSITNFERFIDYLISNVDNRYNKIKSISNFDGLLEHVFGVKLDDGSCEPNEIENINVKELLLMNQLSGPLVDKIFDKYDGLLTYTMSLLTMLTGTKYDKEFKERLSNIMHSLGTSTQVVLLVQRLNKHLKRKNKTKKIFSDIEDKVKSIVESHMLDIPNEAIEDFFTTMLGDLDLSLKNNLRENISDYPNYNKIFSSAVFRNSKIKLKNSWPKYRHEYQEVLQSLQKLNEYFISVVRKTNTITADLFAEGFRASLPKSDIDVCENAGLHIENITSTASTKKANIPEEYYDIKAKLFRNFEKELDKLNSIIAKKSQEELSIRTLKENHKIFSKIFSSLQKNISIWKKNSVFEGYPEEVIFATRVIYSTKILLERMWKIIEPIEDISMSQNSLPQFENVRKNLTKYYIQFRKLNSVVLNVNMISKRLWKLNRELVLKISKDEGYLKNPNKLKELIAEIPKILTKEYHQRLIKKEVKQRKMEKYEELKDIIEEFSNNFSKSERTLLKPFKDIDLENLHW